MSNSFELNKGNRICLRPATMDDRKAIYEWLAHSDLTADMLGQPNFPENPIPEWDEFILDYKEHFFDGTNPRLGRCFVIELNGIPVGQINHDKINETAFSTELDIWLKHSTYTNQGIGTDAINSLCNYLAEHFNCKIFYIAPSARNQRAIKSYMKSGFSQSFEFPENFQPDYHDTILLMKEIKNFIFLFSLFPMGSIWDNF